MHAALVRPHARASVVRASVFFIPPAACLTGATQERREFSRKPSADALLWSLSCRGQESDSPAGATNRPLSLTNAQKPVLKDQAASTSAIGASNLRNRNAFPNTNTLDNAIAPAAKMGDSSMPLKG